MPLMTMQLSDFPYGIFSALRNLFYDRSWLSVYRSKFPVICVGNLSVGGNGKTPLVLYLCHLLKAQGRAPVILSRGYGGSIGGPYLIQEENVADEVGDEPLMLFRKSQCPVVISRKRAEGAKLIEQKSLGDVIILDDGFQHRALYRNLDIICAYVGSPKALKDFRSGLQLPYGRFRESKIQGFRRAKAVVFSSRSVEPLANELLSELKEELPDNLEIFKCNLNIDEITSMDGMTLSKDRPLLVDVFCGLAQPEAFLNSIEKIGFKIVKRYLYKDHAKYSEQELEKILKESEGRAVICSEKDAVKLESGKIKSFFVAKTCLRVEPEEKFLKLILSNIDGGMRSEHKSL